MKPHTLKLKVGEECAELHIHKHKNCVQDEHSLKNACYMFLNHYHILNLQVP